MMKLCEEIRKAFSSKLLCVVIPVFVQWTCLVSTGTPLQQDGSPAAVFNTLSKRSGKYYLTWSGDETALTRENSAEKTDWKQYSTEPLEVEKYLTPYPADKPCGVVISGWRLYPLWHVQYLTPKAADRVMNETAQSIVLVDTNRSQIYIPGIWKFKMLLLKRANSFSGS
jgi:hypothetical protein